MNHDTATTPLTSQPLSPADQMVDRIRIASLDNLIAALPEVVDEAMQKVIPHWYTPELAASLAEGIAAQLRAGVTA
ncbi:hypothetical protein ACI2L1_12010 [Streptomyces sp. NPDC019531]|uniref:hypothetical protein n=1 Tax=Streptomyces sp. NPDC019531 TaxID=3365062 RepID=UPI00384B0600